MYHKIYSIKKLKGEIDYKLYHILNNISWAFHWCDILQVLLYLIKVYTKSSRQRALQERNLTCSVCLVFSALPAHAVDAASFPASFHLSEIEKIRYEQILSVLALSASATHESNKSKSLHQVPSCTNVITWRLKVPACERDHTSWCGCQTLGVWCTAYHKARSRSLLSGLPELLQWLSPFPLGPIIDEEKHFINIHTFLQEHYDSTVHKLRSLTLYFCRSSSVSSFSTSSTLLFSVASSA